MRDIEFVELRGDLESSAVGVVLAGRCMRDSIRLGDVFSVCVSVDGIERGVVLRVEEILLYGQLMDEVTKNMGFELLLSGEDVTELTAGCLLRGVSAH
jgi:hypothetical protein